MQSDVVASVRHLAVAEDESGDLGGGVFLQGGKDVGVGVQGDRYVGVAEALADHFGGDAGGEGSGGI